jgi:hypothetical protein
VKTTIKLRLNRPNLADAIIQFLAEERANEMAADGFWPAEQTDSTLTTSPGQYFYLLPRGITHIERVRLLLTNVWMPLTYARSFDDILLADPVQPPFTAIPSTARAWGRLLRLFPTPNGQYPLELNVTRRVDIPTDDNDTTSFWVDEGRSLIVNRVCEHYSSEVIHHTQWAAMFKQNGDEARDAMTEITGTRNGPTIVRPYL